MKTLNLSIAVLLLAAAAAAQVAAHSPSTPATSAKAGVPIVAPTGKAVARVNGTVLTDHDLLRQMMIAFPYARQHGGKFPKEMEPDIRAGAMYQIIFDELLYQEARRRKMTVAPARLNQAMEDFRKQFDSDVQYRAFLKTEQDDDLARLRNNVQRAMLIDDIMKAEITRKAAVTPVELRAYYDKNRERFRKPESVSIQTISLVIPDNATPQQKAEIHKRAEEALQKARAAKDYEQFGMLAEKVSEDDWRVMMGDHKSIHRGRMPAAVEKAVFAMQPGQVSGIIEAENSYCIARVNAHEASTLMSFQTMRPQLKKELEQMKSDQLEKDLAKRLRKGAKVEVL